MIGKFDVSNARLKTHSMDDYESAIIGCTHNVGAGGVMPIGCADVRGMSIKRFRQWDKRTSRAVGIIIPS